MKIAKYVKVKSTAQKDSKVKDKYYTMVWSEKMSRYYPMDSTYPIDGPASIAKSGIEAVTKEEYKQGKEAEKEIKPVKEVGK